MRVVDRLENTKTILIRKTKEMSAKPQITCGCFFNIITRKLSTIRLDYDLNLGYLCSVKVFLKKLQWVP